MKILHLVDHSFPHLTGYSVRTNSIILHQRRHGCEIIAFTFPTPNFDYPSEDLENCIYHHILPQPSYYQRIPLLRTWRSLSYFVKSIACFFQSRSPCQLIHAHSPWYVGLAALKLGKLWQIPVIYEVRGFWEETSLATAKKQGWLSHCLAQLYFYLARTMENRVLAGADAIAAISASLKSEILARKLDIAPEKIFFVPNCVDSVRFFPRPKERNLLDKLAIQPDETVIGYISSLRSIEGLEYLLYALKLLRHHHIKVLIVGEGSERARLQQLSKTLAIQDRVIFTGKILHQQISDYYTLIDIFVVPRTRDRVCQIVTPLKPLEAMAMGKCVLVSNVGGLLELIDAGQTGYSFEAENQEDLAEKIDYLIENQALREQIGSNARQWVIGKRNWDMLISKYFEIIEFLQLHSMPGGSRGDCN